MPDPARKTGQHRPNLSAITLIYIKAAERSGENCRSIVSQLHAALLTKLMRPIMLAPAAVTTDQRYAIPESMQAWVLGDPGPLMLQRKPVPVPNKAEGLIRIDAVAICAPALDN